MLRIFEKIVDNYKVDPGKLDSLVLRKGLSLIDREALTVESSTVFKKPVRIYVVDSSIMKDRN